MRRLFGEAHGSAAVEFAILVPVLALLLASLSDVSNLIGVALIVNNAAREGARAAIAYDSSWSAKVTDYLSGAGVTSAKGEAVGTVTCAACSPFPPPAGTTVEVHVPVTVSINMPILQNVVGTCSNGKCTVVITGSATMEML